MHPTFQKFKFKNRNPLKRVPFHSERHRWRRPLDIQLQIRVSPETKPYYLDRSEIGFNRTVRRFKRDLFCSRRDPCFARRAFDIKKCSRRNLKFNSNLLVNSKGEDNGPSRTPCFCGVVLVREFSRVVLCTHWFSNAACDCQRTAGMNTRQNHNYTLNLVGKGNMWVIAYSVTEMKSPVLNDQQRSFCGRILELA